MQAFLKDTQARTKGSALGRVSGVSSFHPPFLPRCSQDGGPTGMVWPSLPGSGPGASLSICLLEVFRVGIRQTQFGSLALPPTAGWLASFGG